MNKLVYGIFYLIDSTMIKIDNDIDEFMCVRVLCCVCVRVAVKVEYFTPHFNLIDTQ